MTTPPGCTREACNFRDHHSDLEQAGAVVLGVSTDSVKSHQNFISKYDLPFPLLADDGAKIASAYGAWRYPQKVCKQSGGVASV